MDVTGTQPTDEIVNARGRLVDVMTDMQAYLYEKRVAIAGDPDQVVPLVEMLVTCGAKPVYVITGAESKYFRDRTQAILGETVPEAVIRDNADLFYLHQLMKQEPVDLLISNVYGKYIARAEDVPFVRYGWPILDRVGHSYFPTLGYGGSLHLLCTIINTLLDRKDRDDPDEVFELVL